MVASAVDIDHVVIAYLQNYAEGYEGGGKVRLYADEYFVQYGLSVEPECAFSHIKSTETGNIIGWNEAG